ncbi:PepSY domain-containing protein [Halodurantibacterium flavum]|uniref:PepSY domain-containing protein n=1 Tax=Halodurantibacterium flavum TaxID=1382802 RepID=A0ABW4S1C6_9RHOB
MKTIRTLALGALIALPGALAAQDRPPENAMPLSELLAMIEDREAVVYFEEVEWDDDGYWDVEFHTETGRTTMRIDPVSGEPMARR